MAKRAFLVPIAVALAALTQTAQASVRETGQLPEVAGNPAPSTSQTEERAGAIVGESTWTMNVGGDLFAFVLARTETGEVVAYHRSHYSHESHSSHSSHRSHYSSRY